MVHPHAASGRAFNARAVAPSAYARNFSPTVGIDAIYSHPFIKAWGKSVYLLPEESEFYYRFPQNP
ncbi:MAG: hypothetical protein ACP5HT_01730 [Conexivisphaera sp.]